MKITIEMNVDDDKIEHHSIAERISNKLMDDMDTWGFYGLDPQIEIRWEFRNHSGSRTNERNPS